MVSSPEAGKAMIGTAGAAVSMVKGTESDDGLVPAPMVAVALIWSGPSLNDTAGEQTKWPVASAVTVQTGALSPTTKTETVAPGVAVPSKVGVALLMVLFATGPEITGAEGNVLEPTVKGVAADAGP